MDVRIMGSPCPKCGGCDYYCADCYDGQVAELEAVADAAEALIENRPWLEPMTEGEPDGGYVVHFFRPIGRWEALKDALGALRQAEREENERSRNQEQAYEKALDVVMAARAYVEQVQAGGRWADGYTELAEAVKKWREGE